MNSLSATIRDTKTKGDTNRLRSSGNVPCILYGGKDQNQKLKISKKEIKNLIEKENFLSNVINLKLEGKSLDVLPREVSFDVITDEPIHVDFLRIVKGEKIVLEIPVKFINTENSPGIKRGGVLNIVRRKIELNCPTENIPTEIIVDLDGLDIGSSIKISSVNLPNNVTPTIKGRDFVIATVAAPTIVKEPEKPAEEAAAEGAEATEGTEGAEATAENSTDKPSEGDKNKEADKKTDKKEEKKSPAEKK